MFSLFVFLRSGFLVAWKLLLCLSTILIFNVETYIFEGGILCKCWVPQHFASVSQLPAALQSPVKNTSLEVWSMYFVNVVDFRRSQGPPSPLRLCRSGLRRFQNPEQNNKQ